MEDLSLVRAPKKLRVGLSQEDVVHRSHATSGYVGSSQLRKHHVHYSDSENFLLGIKVFTMALHLHNN